ncbi:MAG TPA: glycoside hydrolase family protein [Verrucomicrobiae bacterium]|nr:glycoside hydrolase family protein [Verrucomicrobiae bacterium]
MDALQQIVRDEGCVLHAYQDSMGFWTIGSGILIDARKGGGITQEESDYLTKNRIGLAARALTFYPWYQTLDEVRQAAVLNMAYNLGVEGLLKFSKMLSAIESQDWNRAAVEMLNSEWATQVKDRAKRLADQIRFGTWQ